MSHKGTTKHSTRSPLTGIGGYHEIEYLFRHQVVRTVFIRRQDSPDQCLLILAAGSASAARPRPSRALRATLKNPLDHIAWWRTWASMQPRLASC